MVSEAVFPGKPYHYTPVYQQPAMGDYDLYAFCFHEAMVSRATLTISTIGKALFIGNRKVKREKREEGSGQRSEIIR
jgi:hypothetical protein